MVYQAIHREAVTTIPYNTYSMVYTVLCCTRQYTGGAATTIPYTTHKSLWYSILLWCTLYSMLYQAIHIQYPPKKIHNSVVLWCIMEHCADLWCTIVNCGVIWCPVLWCTKQLHYGVLSNTQEGVGATSTQPLHMMLARECVHMHLLHFPDQTIFFKSVLSCCVCVLAYLNFDLFFINYMYIPILCFTSFNFDSFLINFNFRMYAYIPILCLFVLLCLCFAQFQL